jgi:N-methylhydantoinase A
MLGRLNPSYFRGGELPLSPEKARQAITRDIAEPLKLDPMRAAFGIVKIADTHMAHAVRLMTVEKGHDPRDFVLVAYGGAGPGHAVSVARELSIGTVVIPNHPGILSAVGMLLTDAKEEFILSRISKLADVDQDAFEKLFTDMEENGIARMKEAGFNDDKIVTHRAVDMRYSGQEFTLRLTLPEKVTAKDFKTNLARRFTELHELRYGHAFDKAVPEIVCLRVEVVGQLPKPKIRSTVNGKDAGKNTTRKGAPESRQVYFENIGSIACGVYHREELTAGMTINGPAVVEEMASTTLIHPGDVARVDDDGNLIITLVPKTRNDA